MYGAFFLWLGMVSFGTSCSDEMDCFNDARDHENNWVECDL